MGFSKQEYWSGVPLPSLCSALAVVIPRSLLGGHLWIAPGWEHGDLWCRGRGGAWATEQGPLEQADKQEAGGRWEAGGWPERSPLDSESSFCSLFLTLHSMTKKLLKILIMMLLKYRVAFLFQNQFVFNQVSYFEIYLDKIRDLLDGK